MLHVASVIQELFPGTDSEEKFAIGMIFTIVGVLAVVLLIWLNHRNAMAKKRLDLLSQSLDHPDLDAATRQKILDVLTKEQGMGLLGWLFNKELWLRLIGGVGWLTFVIAGGLFLLMAAGIIRGQEKEHFLVTALIGLAVVSLPVAVREMAASRERNSSAGSTD